MRDVSGKAADDARSAADETIVLHPSIQTFLGALAAWRFRRAVIEAAHRPGLDGAPSSPRRGRRADQSS